MYFTRAVEAAPLDELPEEISADALAPRRSSDHEVVQHGYAVPPRPPVDCADDPMVIRRDQQTPLLGGTPQRGQRHKSEFVAVGVEELLDSWQVLLASATDL